MAKKRSNIALPKYGARRDLLIEAFRREFESPTPADLRRFVAGLPTLLEHYPVHVLLQAISTAENPSQIASTSDHLATTAGLVDRKAKPEQLRKRAERPIRRPPKAVKSLSPSASQLDEFDKLGLIPRHAQLWRQSPFEAEQARRFSKILKDPAQAIQWLEAGVEPNEYAEWLSLTTSPAIAKRWLDTGSSLADAQAWKRAGVSIEDAFGWMAMGFSRDKAERWLRQGQDAASASPWRKAGVTPSEAETSNRESPNPDAARTSSQNEKVDHEASLWNANGFEPRAMVEWRSAGFDVITATAWRSRAFGPDLARRWSDHGFAHEEAIRWKALFPDPSVAVVWLRSDWMPHPAYSWRTAGWEDPSAASTWRTNGWGPEDALLAHRRGEIPQPANSLENFPEFARTGNEALQSEDRLFGSPRNFEALDKWVSGFGNDVTGPISPAAAKHERATGALPSRITSADVLSIRNGISSRVRSSTYPNAIARFVETSQAVLVDPVEAHAVVHAEIPPPDLLLAVRLPFWRVSVFFAAPFEIGPPETSHIASSPSDSIDAPPYDAALTRLAAEGGRLVGVGLLSGSGGSGLSQACLWYVEIEDTCIPIPTMRSASALDPIAQNIAAALCFGSWCRGMPGRRAVSGSASLHRHARGTSRVHEVVVRQSRPSGVGASTAQTQGRASHLRRGHWHRYWTGSGLDRALEWRWIAPTFVGASRTDTPETVYRLPRLVFTGRRTT